ncbi:MAG: hypothetical protein RIQ53_2808 [Pseudomonadota bacterium]
MRQVTLAFDDTPLPALAPSPAGRPAPGAAAPAGAATAADAIGRRIGWDHAHHRLTPPLAHLHADSPVHAGWRAGRAVYGTRTLAHGPALRHWLALRLQAWQCGEVFEELQVTPLLLSRLAATDHCPVTRRPVHWTTPAGAHDRADGPLAGHETAAAAEATHPAEITRLNPQAAWALGHLVLIERQALQARQALGDARVIARLLQDPACGGTGSSGTGASSGGTGDTPWPQALPAEAWLRLGVLVSFATPLPHARAARIPLRVLPGHGVRVINPVQALQLMLTLQFCASGYARRLLDLAALMPCTQTRQAFQIFMHTLLARRLQAGPRAEGRALRQALEDSWADPLVLRRWQRLALRLGAADCERLLQRATQRGLVVGGGCWISGEQATDGWGLPARSAALVHTGGEGDAARVDAGAGAGAGAGANAGANAGAGAGAVTLLPASGMQARLRRGSPWPHPTHAAQPLHPPALPAGPAPAPQTPFPAAFQAAFQGVPSGAAYFRAGRLRNLGSQKLAS